MVAVGCGEADGVVAAGSWVDALVGEKAGGGVGLLSRPEAGSKSGSVKKGGMATKAARRAAAGGVREWLLWGAQRMAWVE